MSTPYAGGPAGATAADAQFDPAQQYGSPPQYGTPQPQQYGTGQPEHGYGAPGQPVTADGHPDVEGASVGQLIGEVSRDLSTLMRQELELAKAEVKAEAGKAGKGVGLLGAAGFAGYMVLLFLSIALWSALSNLMDPGWAGLIVAVLWGIVAAVAYSMGRTTLKHVNPKPERTLDTLQQVPGALTPR